MSMPGFRNVMLLCYYGAAARNRRASSRFRLLADLGTDRRSPLALTGREREIVNLVSQGLSSRAIAEALTASVRTVEGHIYRVMSRLGVRNRAELSALVREYDGVAVNSSGAVRSGQLQR
jgi:DNA-binding CsgD family transcriptional regulator